MRLIDADALEKDMRKYADNKAYCGHIELANGILKGVGRIDLAPTIDAVAVVRCGQCKHWDTKKLYCHHPAGISWCEKRAAREGFCCFGERRVDHGTA